MPFSGHSFAVFVRSCSGFRRRHQRKGSARLIHELRAHAHYERPPLQGWTVRLASKPNLPPQLFHTKPLFYLLLLVPTINSKAIIIRIQQFQESGRFGSLRSAFGIGIRQRTYALSWSSIHYAGPERDRGSQPNRLRIGGLVRHWSSVDAPPLFRLGRRIPELRAPWPRGPPWRTASG